MKISLMHSTLQPHLIGNFAIHFSSKQNDTAGDDPTIAFTGIVRPIYADAICIILCSFSSLSSLVSQPFNLYMVKMGVESRLICCSMVCRKVRDNFTFCRSQRTFKYIFLVLTFRKCSPNR